MNHIFSFLRSVLERYSIGQRIVIVTLLLGLVSTSIALVMWANRPEFDTLYSDLDAATAGKVISELRSAKVKYELQNNGKTILVPVNQVAEMRLKFAESGVVNNVIDGYEIFDQSSIGMTTFMQQLNLRRALEGELTKTVNEFPIVKHSRVHLVLPETKLFGKDQQGSASVVLYLQPGKKIGRDQVQSIAALVANSVEHIDQEDVVVVDADGKLLTDSRSDDSAMGSVGNRWDFQHTVETRLQNKVMNILTGIVGFENAVVQVAVDLNFEQISRTQELYDPDNVVVVGEERHTASTVDTDSANQQLKNQTNEDVITNYELNKTVEHYVGDSGTIDKLSVAVLVNGEYESSTAPDGEQVRTFKPRSSQQLQQIESLVRSAVGYDADRGDMVTVNSIQFNAKDIAADLEYFKEVEQREMWGGIINKSLLGIGLLVAFFLMRLMLRSTGKSLVEASEQLPAGPRPTRLESGGSGYRVPEEEEISEDLFMKKLSPEARAQIKAKDKMTEEVLGLAKEQPEDAARLIRTWLTQVNLTNQSQN
ncbi:MAG: flagellar M-ring protein FliF [Candidatus Marinimicrobia bacterium]|nr:flagellar M-ring protein FliF [Candidatus Neomarinimicrobiota bacterium]MCF7841163.1 flagellar M-ring protein FliF [Candidatus Neomarinimicrobiota bacterium]MCF7901936.1 flagellar M-ring protein FliF [Candidatus Neomarinimicrobiota bacterium]